MYLLLLLMQVAGFNLGAFNARKSEALRTGVLDDFLGYARAQRDSYPAEAEVHFGLAEALVRIENFAMATRSLKDALRNRPQEATVQRCRVLLESHGRLGEQIELYGEYRKIVKNRTAGAYEVAGLYRRLDNYAAAATELLNWLRFDSLAAAGQNLEAVAQQLSQCYRLDRKVRSLVAGAPLDRRVRARLMARLYLVDQAYEPALREYFSLGDPRALDEFARLCRSKGLDSLAVVCYERLGMNVEAARVYVAHRRFEHALILLRDDRSTAGRVLRAQCQTGLGDAAAAAKALDSMSVQSWPASAFILSAKLYVASGDYAAAESRLDRGLGVVARESLPRVLWTRCELLFAQSRLSEAVPAYNELAANFPGSPLANDALERLFLIRRAGADTSMLRAFGHMVMLRMASADGPAIDSARSFIKRWSPLAEYGHEFIVETHTQNTAPELALAAIGEYEKAYPTGSKLARLLLVKAELCLKTGQEAQARAALEKLLADFGGSPESGAAREMLKGL